MIDYPLSQGGMIWASGWRLSRCGSMPVDWIIGAGANVSQACFKKHIQKMQKKQHKKLGAEIYPCCTPDFGNNLWICCAEGVKIVVTSAGNPKKHGTTFLKEK